jgi:hypothetical protein
MTLPPDLLGQLEQAASERALTSNELLEVAVRTYLRQIEREKLEAENKAFRAMQAELVGRYRGQHVAIHNGAVIDHDPDVKALEGRVRERLGRRPVLIKRVEAEPEHVHVFRSLTFPRGEA